MTRNSPILIAAAALMLVMPAAASAATDGTSNTIMFAELRQRPVTTGFMDYTDDSCMLLSTPGRR